MEDCNTTLMALEIATSKLNLYTGFSMLASTISVVAIIISFIVAKKQLEANHDWNRRSFTSSQLKDFIKQLSSIRDELDRLTTPITVIEDINGEKKEVIKNEVIKNDESKFINFTDRLLLNKILTADEVHKWVCKEDPSNPSNYVKTAIGDGKPCKTTNNGEIIVNNLLEFISIYEQIAVALLNKVFDEQIVSDTLKHPIKKNYEFYKEYIQHRRDKHEDTNFAESFKQMYIKFWGESLTGDSRKKTEG